MNAIRAFFHGLGEFIGAVFWLAILIWIGYMIVSFITDHVRIV